MNKTITAIAIGILTTASATALAQTPGWGYGPGFGQPAASTAQPAPGYGPGQMRGMRGDPAQRISRRVDYLAGELSLNDDQKTRIQGILEEQNAKRMRMRGETHDLIAGVLSDEQRVKFDQIRANFGQGRQGGWGRGGPCGGPGMGYGQGMGRGMGYGPGPGFTPPAGTQ